jgi:uncharacterized membrane protein YidH (DUF202 family)
MEYLCAIRSRILIFHMLLWFGFALNTITLAAVQLSPAGRAVAMMNYPGLVAMLLGTGVVILKCGEA